MTEGKVFRLKSEPNNYPWGKVGQDSLAAVLSKEASGNHDIKKDEPYAELWMGTHPNNPSHLFARPSNLLSDHLKENPKLLGDANKFTARYPQQEGGSASEFGGEGHVPFLFKILTCKQALPLQIHPNIELAKKLHEDDPEQFPDTNHKPEIAVCLSDRFLGFAGLRPISQILQLIHSTPEIGLLPTQTQTAVQALTSLSDDDGSKDSSERLKAVFGAFTSMEGNQVQHATKAFTQRIVQEGPAAFGQGVVDEKDKKRLVEAASSLDKYYPGDGSTFVTLLLMNLVELKKGEGMYVGADGPHAWLSGEIVELMAASDNVLNVGFTPDKNSTSLVAKTITAKPTEAGDIILKSQAFDKGSKGHTTVYATPFEEFSILRIEGAERMEPLSGPGIAIVTRSSGTSLGDAGEQRHDAPEGSVWFIGAGTDLRVEGDGEIWMAFYDGDRKSGDQVGKQ